MAGREALESFIEKWRASWPEWQVAGVFVPVREREQAWAWLALRQELVDAAWGGSDPRPGEAKLGWWVEELQGWAQGRRRHPLGIVLQPLAAPWGALALALPSLGATRVQPRREALLPFSQAVSAVSAVLAPEARPTPPEAITSGLLAQRLVEGEPGDAAALLRDWPSLQHAPRLERVHAALLQSRLRAKGQGHAGTPPRWRSLLTAWRAARG